MHGNSHHIHYPHYFFAWESGMRILIRQWAQRNAGVLFAGFALLVPAAIGVSCGGSTQMQTPKKNSGACEHFDQRPAKLHATDRYFYARVRNGALGTGTYRPECER